jgi:hypothetical protein
MNIDVVMFYLKDILVLTYQQVTQVTLKVTATLAANCTSLFVKIRSKAKPQNLPPHQQGYVLVLQG